MDAIGSALSGIQQAQTSLAVRANNIANVNTPGFKPSRANTVDAPGSSGTALGSITPDGRQADLTPTGNPTDLALEGPGYFVLKGADGLRFTRSGDFHLDANGTLTASSGAAVQRITTSGDLRSITLVGTPDVSRQGAISVGGQAAGQLAIATFANPAGLQADGQNQLLSGAGSGLPSISDAASGRQTVLQGFLEGSGTSLTRDIPGSELDLSSVRANIAVIHTQDQMTRSLLGI